MRQASQHCEASFSKTLVVKQTPEQREPKIFLMLDESIYKKYIQYCTVKLDIYNIPINLIYIYIYASPPQGPPFEIKSWFFIYY